MKAGATVAAFLAFLLGWKLAAIAYGVEDADFWDGASSMLIFTALVFWIFEAARESQR